MMPVCPNFINLTYMRFASLIFGLVFFLVLSSFAQDVQYGTGKWDREGLGNHRAVIEVGDNSETVYVRIPWRRRDASPEKKDLILVDAATGKSVANLFRKTINAEFGEIVFQPVTGKGIYYLYFMPSRNSGNWWLPQALYSVSKETSDPHWLKKNVTNNANLPEAKVLRFEAVSDEHSFYPMAIPATDAETGLLVAKYPDRDFIVFTEDRKLPVQMTESLPARWVKDGKVNQFSGLALRNEFYVFQLAVFASKIDLTDIQLKFSSLKGADGKEIPARAIRCFNHGGKDWLGKQFSKKISIPRNHVQALWVGVDVAEHASPGTYSGVIEVGDRNLKPQKVAVTITVKDDVIANRGYDDLARLSRLNWLDSDIGLDDRVAKPYSPITVKGQTVHILGRSLTFGSDGFPKEIISTYNTSNTAVTGAAQPILGGAIKFSATEKGKELTWKAGKPVIVSQSSGAVSWNIRNTNPKADMVVSAKMEYDGYINYEVTLTAKKDIHFDDLQLLIPYARSAATYVMGMGKKGGARPPSWDWKWEADKANNMVWMGSVNAGMQCKLKHETPDWKMYGFDETGPYKDWSNNGLGGCTIREIGQNVLLRAFTGAKTVKSGQTLHFNFGLLITPLKPLDNEHWNQRYFQADPPVNTWMSRASKGGATIMNIHQGNKLNPYINYPFAATENLKKYITEAKNKGIRSKLYYTVRELSVTNTAELWPLMSLGDEVFTRGVGTQLADQFAEKPQVAKKPTGATWLTEHLIKGYDPAWHNPLESGEMDISIRTTGLSRWHNYYLEGLGWLVKNTGMKGIYLDGVGYDREIMKRVRKVMDNAADSCLIDFHSGNNFHPEYGLNSPVNQYMELFPSVNSLWIGEGYDYEKEPEDYWLVEISGIPLGLYSEMLHNCGNFYKGMLYGMTSRLGWTSCNPTPVWKFWDETDIKNSEMKGYWNKENPVKSTNANIKTTSYQKEKELILVISNWSAVGVPADLTVDWAALGMDKKDVAITVPAIDGYQTGADVKTLGDIKIEGNKGLIIWVKKK
jgi:hypothetical protein